MNIEQSTKLVQTLSPAMLQTMALLPLSVTELQTYIQNEIESNPALELPYEDTQSIDTLSDGTDFSYSDDDGEFTKEKAIENSSIVQETLSEHLLVQLGETETDNITEEISRLLIGNLDANGFFIIPLDNLFENRNYTQDQINSALSIVQSFEPYGICVKDFRESLILQAKCWGMEEDDLEIFSKIVNNYLDQVETSKTREVASALHISTEDLLAYWDILKTFTPYPGRNYDTSQVSYAVPEFSIHKKEGSLVLTMNKANLPDLEISEEFEKLSDNLSKDRDKETKAYISESIQKAKSLIGQINLRYKTLYNTALILMDKQEDFFLNGPDKLKPMTLKDVATELDVHETTVSRLSQSKWVETDWGLFQLKYFFSQGVGDVSRNSVKTIIEKILKENPKLSDQKVSDKLKEMNISCARRTVNKYRAEMGI